MCLQTEVPVQQPLKDKIIIISCAGDNALASDLYNYLLNSLSQRGLNSDAVALHDDEIDITAQDGKIKDGDAHRLLSSYLESNPEKYGNHTITRLENIFTIGVKMDLLKEMKICEYCGYMSKDYHDLYNHRLLCFSLTRFGI